MIKAFLIVTACLRSTNFTQCEPLTIIKITGPNPPYWCQLNRPAIASLFQTQVDDGWLTFTRCEIVDSSEGGGLE